MLKHSYNKCIVHTFNILVSHEKLKKNHVHYLRYKNYQSAIFLQMPLVRRLTQKPQNS